MQLRNKVLKIVLSCLAVISLLLPFQMYADTTFTVSNIVGVNAVMSDSIMNGNITYSQSGNTQTVHQYTTTYDVEIVFDQAYLGYVQLTLEYNYYNQIGYANTTTVNSNTTRRVYVNGSSVHINLSINSIGSSPSCLIVQVNNPKVSTVTAGSTSMTPIGDLSTLQDILDVLTVIQQNVEIDVLNELEQIVIDLGFANDYLEILSLMRNWSFPIESFSFVSSFMYYNKQYLTDYYINYNTYTYPVFDLPQSAMIYPISSNTDDFYMILFIADNQAYNLQNIKNQIIDFGTLTVDEFTYWGNTRMWQNGMTGYFVKFTIHVNGSTSMGIRTKKAVQMIPIYFSRKSIKNISTEFALQFGLTNQLIDDLNIIANGSTSSNNSSNNLESQNTQFSTDSSNLMNLEDTLGNQMNDNLEQIDTNFDVGNQFGSKFLASAEWVRNQYNTLTSNTPFGTFISFSLLIGLALLLMGRLL